jgi:hypothetical protein
MKKEKEPALGLFLCLHTDGCFFGKEPLQEHTYIYPQKSFDI